MKNASTVALRQAEVSREWFFCRSYNFMTCIVICESRRKANGKYKQCKKCEQYMLMKRETSE